MHGIRFAKPLQLSCMTSRPGQLASYLQKISITQKFHVIIGVVIAILIIEFGCFWITVNILSDIRSYVSAEALWSKSQKESMVRLISYSATYSESDYKDFVNTLSVPLHDESGRVELQKRNPNYAAAREAFREALNRPKDADGMVFLFRYFSWQQYLSEEG